MKLFQPVRPALKQTYLLSVLLPFAQLSGCASLSQTLISPEVQSPVVTGHGGIDLVFSASPGRSVDLYDDASARPPIFSTSFEREQDDGAAIYGGLGWGAIRGLSLTGGLLGGDALVDGAWIGGKIQLVGRQGMLADSPFYVAAYARTGGQYGTKEGDRDGDFGPHGFPWEATREGSFFNAGLSLGYGITDSIVAFVGAGKGVASSQGTVEQKAGTGGSPAATYRNSFEAETATWGGGIQFGRETRFALLANRTRIESGGFRVMDTQVGASLELKIRGPKDAASSSE